MTTWHAMLEIRKSSVTEKSGRSIEGIKRGMQHRIQNNCKIQLTSIQIVTVLFCFFWGFLFIGFRGEAEVLILIPGAMSPLMINP